MFLGISPGYRLVALKVIRPEYAGDREFLVRFRREVAIARQASGPFTAPIIAAQAGQPPLWLATLYVPAPTLAEAIAGAGPLPEPALRSLGAGLAEALGSVHAAGVIHRDLKPANVLLAGDGPRLIDFGISRALEGTRLTRTGTVLGTLGFMSPEQIASGREPGAACDVFSLGAVLAFAGTGRAPFGSGNTEALLYRIVHEPADLAGLPGALKSLIAACLDKTPERRPRPAELLAALAPSDPRALDTPYLAAEAARRGQEAAQLIAAAQGAQPFQEPVPVPFVPPGPPGPPAPPVPAGSSEGAIAVQPQPANEALPDSPEPRRTLGRRRVLALGAGTAVAVAGGSAALAAMLGGSTPAPPPVTRLPRTQAWAATPDWVPGGGASLVVAGDMVLWSDPAIAVALSAADGRQAWAYAPSSSSLRAVVPPGAVFQNWLGVAGSILYGRASFPGASGQTVVFGVAAAGQRVVEQALPQLPSGVTLCAVSGNYLLMVDPGAGRLMAFDLSTGRLGWSRPLQATGQDPPVAVAADSARCYLQDTTTTYGLELTSGAVQWTTPDTVPAPAISSSVTLVSGSLVVSGYGLAGLDPATGHQRWTAVNEWRASLLNGAQGIDGPSFSAVTAVGEQAVFTDPANRIWSVDAGSGSTTWKYQAGQSPGLAYPSPGVLQGGCASADLVAVASGAGFLAVETATGKPLGGYGAWVLPSAGTVVTVSGRDVYLVTGSTVYGYKGAA